MDVGAVEARGEELRQSVDALYGMFERYGRPKDFVYSPGRLPENHVALRDVAVNWCCWYSSKAVTSVGTLADFKHFLPRLLEVGIDLWVSGKWPPTDAMKVMPIELPMLATRMEYAGFADWPEVEKAAVVKVIRCAWRLRIVVPDEELGSPRRGHDYFDELFVPFFCLSPDMSWVVEDWTQVIRTAVLREWGLMYLARVLVEGSDDIRAFEGSITVSSSQSAMMARLFGNRVLLRFLIEKLRVEKGAWLQERLEEGIERSREYRKMWMAYRQNSY